MNALNILLDGGLLSASLAACFYCVLLSRRVRRLASADQGVGKGIADMVLAVERLNASLERTRMAARTESDTLRRQLTEAKALSEKTVELLEEGDHLSNDLARGLADARHMVAALEDLADAADKRRARTRAAAQPPDPIALEDDWDAVRRTEWRDSEARNKDPAPAADAKPAPRRRRKAEARPAASATPAPMDENDITMLLLDAIDVDMTDQTDDPLPDVRPRASRHTRNGARAMEA